MAWSSAPVAKAKPARQFLAGLLEVHAVQPGITPNALFLCPSQFRVGTRPGRGAANLGGVSPRLGWTFLGLFSILAILEGWETS